MGSLLQPDCVEPCDGSADPIHLLEAAAATAAAWYTLQFAKRSLLLLHTIRTRRHCRHHATETQPVTVALEATGHLAAASAPGNPPLVNGNRKVPFGLLRRCNCRFIAQVHKLPTAAMEVALTGCRLLHSPAVGDEVARANHVHR